MKLIQRVKLKILDCLIGRFFDDEKYLQIKYYLYTGKKLNLHTPELFSEKLQWLKLNPICNDYSTIVDKITFKNFVAETIGDKKNAKLLGVWKSPADIDIDKLPEKFVLKCNHDSGSTMIINKKEYCKEEIVRFFNKRLSSNYFYLGREWPYKNIEPKVFAEELLPIDSMVRDIKFLCFDGKPKVAICYGNDGSKKMTYYDMEWNKIDCYHSRNPNNVHFSKPQLLSDLIKCSEKMSRGMPFVRVDFLVSAEHFWISEMTFFPSSGFSMIVPEKYEKLFGSWIKLP